MKPHACAAHCSGVTAMRLTKKLYCRIYQLGFRIAMPMLPYREPKIFRDMQSLAEELAHKKKKSVLIVTDAQVSALHMTEGLEKALDAVGIAHTVYDKTIPNPTFNNIREASEVFTVNHCDTIVGFGGGSSMDCAKAVGANVAHPGKDISKLVGIFKVHCRIPLLVAVPTTAGTGSEVTLAAVLTNSENGIKVPMYDFALIPTCAVHDWTLTENLPKSLTATTGMDALTHAVEAYIGQTTSRYTRQKSEECVRLVHDYLYRAYVDGSDREARQNMLTAAYDGGIALTQSYVGYIHALAHALGGLYGTPHGLANSVIMPYILKLYGSSVWAKLAHLARMIREADDCDPDQIAAEKFIAWICEMNRKMKIPTHIEGIDPKDFSFMAERADKEANPLYPVPKLYDRRVLEKMYHIVCRDEKGSKRMKKYTAKDNACTSKTLLENQKAFFETGATMPVSFRIQMLRRLYDAVKNNHKLLTDAITKDLGKSESEGYMCEVGLVLGEIRYQMNHLKKWAAPEVKVTDLVNSFGQSYVLSQPLGNVLIMAPWNYPVLLSFEPLAGAIAAGNTVILKPSAYAPETSRAMAQLIEKTFIPEFVTVVEGGRAENDSLLDLPFDHIFFTGSVAVGRIVMERAAKNLTPVTLELGGKSPVIVDHTADIPLAAKRIVFGKLLNCGQTCIAPDYILVERSVHDDLIRELKKQFAKQCPDPFTGSGFAHIVNEKHFKRVRGLIDSRKVVYGGACDVEALRIEPTILDGVTPDDACMGQEIFGPVLPVLTVENVKEAEAFVRSREKPLALYIFTSNRKTQQRFLRMVPFGGGCVNDTISHILSPRLPFGGVGQSGTGRYHGYDSFRTFSYRKSVVKKYRRPDLPMRYTPYKKIYEKMIRLIQR